MIGANKVKLSIISVGLFILLFLSLIIKAEKMGEYQGLKIKFDEKAYKETKEIRFDGTLSTFVNCGSQYAIWNQFPGTILYTLKDLDTGQFFESIDNELSISWDGNVVYDMYAKQPCDIVVTKEFSTLLTEVYFKNSLKKTIVNFELHAYYFGHTSNTLIIKNTPIVLKGF